LSTFTAALKPDHQDRGGRVVDLQLARFGVVAGEDMDELVMDDLDDLLTGGDRLRDRLAGGLLLNRLHEVAGHGQRDVGFEKRDSDLAEGRLDVVLRKRALPRQPVEDTAEAFRKILEHCASFRCRSGPEIGRDRSKPKCPHGRNSLVGGDPGQAGTGSLQRFRMVRAVWAKPPCLSRRQAAGFRPCVGGARW